MRAFVRVCVCPCSWRSVDPSAGALMPLCCLSQGHGVCSHVPDKHHLHAVVLAADLLQRDLPTREGTSMSSTRGAAGRLASSDASVLQGWVYNVVPWLCAIPLTVGGGYVSDLLINKGGNPAAIFNNMSFYDT